MSKSNPSSNPLLIFPKPIKTKKHKLGGGSSKFKNPSGSRQIQRIGPCFDVLRQAFDSEDNERARIQADPGSCEIEKVIVIELVGNVADFFKTIKKIEGLEWLAEYEKEVSPDEDFYISDKDKDSNLKGRLYLIMSNQQGLTELFSLWKTFCEDPNSPDFAYGFMRFKELFQNVKDIRHWGAIDRIRETGIKEDWEDSVKLQQSNVRVEIELWCRLNAEEKQISEQTVTQLVNNSGGKVLTNSNIEEIAYHALLAELPIDELGKIVTTEEAELVVCDHIMYFRPVGQAVTVAPFEDVTDVIENVPSSKDLRGDPIVAILDGMPLESHDLLKGKIIVDDKDDLGSAYQSSERIHGTSMASLIINGELDEKESVLESPVYIRPILKPDEKCFGPRPYPEVVPDNYLIVDLIYRSVLNIFEGEQGGPPVAPSIKVINLSIGLPGKPYVDRFPSALARLLDFLSVKYRVLIFVSAGNYLETLDIEDKILLSKGKENELFHYLITENQSRNRFRRILAPAEGINVITVGSTHDDFSVFELTDGVYDIYPAGVPSPLNANGLGFKRSVKPDILFPGGRQIFRFERGGSGLPDKLVPVRSNRQPGQRVAAPSVKQGVLNAVQYSRGTSNSTALASREAVKIYHMLEKLKQTEGYERISECDEALMLKALIVHGAKWGDSGKHYSEVFGESNRDTITKFLGYGKVSKGLVFGCPNNRATLMGFGELKIGEADRYEIPLPQSLSGKAVARRIIVTLAWFTPVTSRNREYRQVQLWFSGYGDRDDGDFGEILRVKRKACHWQTVKRGTVQHEIFEGEDAATFSQRDNLFLQVNCKEEFAGVQKDISVPYSLVVSFDVAEDINLPIYQQIRERIIPKIIVPVIPAT